MSSPVSLSVAIYQIDCFAEFTLSLSNVFAMTNENELRNSGSYYINDQFLGGEMKMLKTKYLKKKRGFTLIELPAVRKRAFTLIELLIVIAIIGILATVIVVSYVNAQAKSRDNKRRADVQAIASAHQLMYQDSKKWFVPGTGSGGNGIGWFNYTYGTYDSIAHGLETGKYIDSAPRDPKMKNDNDATGYMVYRCTAGGVITGVKIYAKLENKTDQEESDAKSTTGASAGCTYPGYGMNYSAIVK